MLPILSSLQLQAPLSFGDVLAVQQKTQRYRSLWVLIFAAPLVMGCTKIPPSEASLSPIDRIKEPPHIAVTSVEVDTANSEDGIILNESWKAYRERFIQADGRVIDFEGEARTVSEGQAYAMLRAVLIDDPETFEITLKWAENNLRRSPQPNDADGQDYLWAWLWGERPDGTWGIRDANFASDADIDAITALILASRRWNRPDYLELAVKKLEDLWNQSTVKPLTLEGSTSRFLLPGPITAFQPQPGKVYINPSYLAPYAFKLFAEVDPNENHDWMLLVDSSYDILEQTKSLSQNGLPGDWIWLDLTTQEIQPVSQENPLKSQYSFDAYRVWWRVTWDVILFGDVRAEQFLNSHLSYFQSLWETEGKIPAVMDLSGQALVDYEATSQYAMLYTAFKQFNPDVAASIRNQKLFATYTQGVWDDPHAYYVQNLAWLGLLPQEEIQSTFTSEF